MNKMLLEIKNAVPRASEFQFKTPINWSLKEREQWAFIGPNGAGKTILSHIITGKIPLKEGKIDYHFRNDKPIYQQIKIAAFQDIYSLADYKSMYYQQRWNSSEAETPLVEELLKKEGEKEEIEKLISLFGVEDLLTKNLISLSSGELRKFLIIRMLISEPRILILDNPYIGLDEKSRELLNELLGKLSKEGNTQIILLLSDPNEIPVWCENVLPIYQKNLQQDTSDSFPNPILKSEEFPDIESQDQSYQYVLEMHKIQVKYQDRIILKDLSWNVKSGEKWALLGPNGAGKSTLLSLIYADNPQGYANKFSLFGKKRGSGESIWEIKKRIGYVSSEIHLYCTTNQSCLQIVGSGLFDSIGLFRKCSEEQLQIAKHWMKIFQIEHLMNQSFLQISFGEQRLVILARAFVKNPDLLILDEPLHGLDKGNKELVLHLIENYCNQKNKTLIYVTHYENEIPSSVSQRLYLNRRNE